MPKSFGRLPGLLPDLANGAASGAAFSNAMAGLATDTMPTKLRLATTRPKKLLNVGSESPEPRRGVTKVEYKVQ